MAPKKGRQSKGKSNNKQSPVPRTSAAAHGKQRMKLQETVENTGAGYHQMYKDATLRFHNWMAQVACPGLRMSAVDDYRKGVDFIVNQNMKVYLKEDEPSFIVAPPEIMANLASSIRLRERVTTRMFGSKDGGDVGHRYIIDVLEYCRCALRFGNRIAAVCKAKNEGDEQEQEEIGGRFHALTLDEDDGEEEEEEVDWTEIDRDIKEGNVPQYGGVQVEEEIDIFEALLKGDDSFQAMALLDLMEELMEDIYDQYVVLKEHMRGLTRQDSSCMQLLMESAVVANAATECVQRAENEMMIDHPHLSSFSHVLALVFLSTFVAKINKRIAKTKLQANPHMALDFVAEVFECAILNGTYKHELHIIVKRFVKKSGLTADIVQHYAECVQNITWTETFLEFEQRQNSLYVEARSSMGLTPHMWFSFYEHIGGDRCLLNTHKIVRMMLMFCSQKHTGRMAVIDPEWLGKPFDENKRPARRILGDLDEPFLSSIIPELAAICKTAPIETLPNRSNLLTVVDLLHRQVKSGPTKPVPVALTFGFHAIAMSIYVIQGQGDLARLASNAKQSFDMMFEQLDTVADRNKTPGYLPKVYDFVHAISEISNFAKSCYVFENGDVHRQEEHMKAVMLAFWNPLIAGEYMLYATYICSINFGSITLNSSGQLKFALHLYNGLKLHNPKMDVPFLRNLDLTFKDAKPIWVGGKPGIGSCYKALWMSFGMSASQAARLVTSGHEDNIQRFLDEPRNWAKELSDSVIRPESFSSSYRRLVLQDFGSVNITSTEKHDSFLSDLRSRISVIQESINRDKDHVLPLNFTAVGSILLEFVNSLIDHMGLSIKMQESVSSTPALRLAREKAPNIFDANMKFHWMLHSLAHILSSVDKGNTENLQPEFDFDKIAEFTKSFFDGIKTSRYAFFVDEEETIEATTPRNPLEVSYPYGRTGRTPHDPLQAHTYSRRNRRGNLGYRLVIPGSLTPPFNGMYVYNGENKLQRGPRGNYRHIASYSLQELIDLNWDGSLYPSKTAGGAPVPFIHGYDSDSDDEYEPIDIERAKREGTIGQSVGLYVLAPGLHLNGEPLVMKLPK